MDMDIDITFSREELAGLRMDARRLGVRLPVGMTALRISDVGHRRQYLVESRDGFREWVGADNAYDARVKAIEFVMRKAGHEC